MHSEWITDAKCNQTLILMLLVFYTVMYADPFHPQFEALAFLWVSTSVWFN